MARFKAQVPDELINSLKSLSKNSEQMMGEMTQESGKVVQKNIVRNMQGKFKTPDHLVPYLKVTKVYKTKDDAINTKVAFYGYHHKERYTEKQPYRMTKKLKSGKKVTYEYPGVPVPLIVIAREYGTKVNGKEHERKMPFIRPSFNKKQIEETMDQVQNKYLPKD